MRIRHMCFYISTLCILGDCWYWRRYGCALLDWFLLLNCVYFYFHRFQSVSIAVRVSISDSFLYIVHAYTTTKTFGLDLTSINLPVPLLLQLMSHPLPAKLFAGPLLPQVQPCHSHKPKMQVLQLSFGLFVNWFFFSITTCLQSQPFHFGRTEFQFQEELILIFLS